MHRAIKVMDRLGMRPLLGVEGASRGLRCCPSADTGLWIGGRVDKGRQMKAVLLQGLQDIPPLGGHAPSYCHSGNLDTRVTLSHNARRTVHIYSNGKFDSQSF